MVSTLSVDMHNEGAGSSAVLPAPPGVPCALCPTRVGALRPTLGAAGWCRRSAYSPGLQPLVGAALPTLMIANHNFVGYRSGSA